MARRKLQKLFALLLTFSMSMSLLGVTAFAEDEKENPADGGTSVIALDYLEVPDEFPASLSVDYGTSFDDVLAQLPDVLTGSYVEQAPMLLTATGEEEQEVEENLDGDAVSGDAVNGDAVSGDAVSGDAVSGDAVSGDAVNGDAVSGDAVSGGAVNGDAVSGDAVSGGAVSGDAVSGDAVNGDAVSGDAVSGGAVNGDAVNGDAVNGDAANGDVADSDTIVLTATSVQSDGPSDDDSEMTRPEPNPPMNYYVDVPVTWTCEDYDPLESGTYSVTVVLGEGFEYVGTDPLPSVEVTVGAKPEAVAQIGETTYETLAAAVKAAQNGDTITLLSNIYESTVNVEHGEATPEAPFSLTIDMDGYTIFCVHSPGEYRMVSLMTVGYVDLTIKDGIFRGIETSDFVPNGAISCTGVLRMENCVVQDINAAMHGAVSVSTSYGARAYLEDCQFINNSCDNYSGAPCPGALMVRYNRETVLTNVDFIGNEAGSTGGALYVYDVNQSGTLKITGGSFVGNSATNSGSSGGAIYAFVGSLEMNGVSVQDNSASYLGGGVYFWNTPGTENSQVVINNCVFSGNSAQNGGALGVGVYSGQPAQVSVAGSTFSGNHATGNGGAIYSTGGCTLEINATLKENTAGGWGGAIYADTGSVTLDGVMNENEASLGGGVFAQSGTVTVNGDAAGNSATKGGALYVNMGSATVHGDLTGNVAEESGGAVYCSWSGLTVTGKVTGNSAAEGGGVYVFANASGEQWASRVDLTDAMLCNNLASYAGADLYDGGQNVTTIQTVGEGWSLDACRNHTIDNWYTDAAGARWSHTRAQVYAMGEDGTATITEPTALRAAHKLMVLKPDEPNADWETSKSKTATGLDANYESQVTLSLPAAEETPESDIVFVVDKSTSSRDESTEGGLEMLENLAASIESTDAVINVGIIVFDGTSHVMRELSPYDAADVAEKMSAAIPEEEDTSGTNMEAGLLAAQSMLAADTGVDNNRKYVILISDGLTRLFTGSDGETVQIIFNQLEADGTRYFGEYTTWCLSNGLGDGEYKVPGGVDWLTYYTTVIKPQVEADGDTYVMDFDGDSTKKDTVPEKYIPIEEVQDHAQAVDRAFYDAYQAYLDLSAAYHCYAIYTGKSELGSDFMSTLNNGESLDFDDIQNDIYYLLDAGSQILDVIGYGTDDKGNNYNFDFVNSLDTLRLTVGGVELSKEELVDPQYSMPGVTSAYGFGGGEDGYDFVLYYYENGQDGASDECFVWEINVPVSNFAPVQLTYTVKLTNPQTAPGTYGGLYTNDSATLYPVDTDGKDGTPEEFEKPVVDYTISGGSDDPTPPSGGGTEIPEGGTPTTELPEEETPTTEQPEEESTEIPEEETPLAEVPETGDWSALWLAMTALSGTGLAGVTFLGRKKRDEE